MFHLLKSIQSLLKVSSWTVLIKLQNKFMKIKMQILFLPDYISLLFSSFVKKFFETFTSTIFDSSNVNCLKVTLVLHRKHLPYLLANSIWWIKKYNFFSGLKFLVRLCQDQGLSQEHKEYSNKLSKLQKILTQKEQVRKKVFADDYC